MNDLTSQVKKNFSENDIDLKNLGDALDYQWDLKKKLEYKISNYKIDSFYNFGKIMELLVENFRSRRWRFFSICRTR